MLIQSTKSRQYISTFNYCNLNVVFPMGLDAVLKSIVDGGGQPDAIWYYTVYACLTQL